MSFDHDLQYVSRRILGSGFKAWGLGFLGFWLEALAYGLGRLGVQDSGFSAPQNLTLQVFARHLLGYSGIFKPRNGPSGVPT